MAEEEYLAGIDPGLATGGFVVLRLRGRALSHPPEVVWATSLVETKKQKQELVQLLPEYYRQRPGDREYALADLRAREQVRKVAVSFEEFTKEFPAPLAFAVESFIDQGSRANGPWVKDRWKTPHMIGRLVTFLESQTYTVQAGGVLFQDAGVALKQLAPELDRLAKGETVVPGSSLLVNDHLRKAWAHAHTLALRWPIN